MALVLNCISVFGDTDLSLSLSLCLTTTTTSAMDKSTGLESTLQFSSNWTMEGLFDYLLDFGIKGGHRHNLGTSVVAVSVAVGSGGGGVDSCFFVLLLASSARPSV